MEKIVIKDIVHVTSHGIVSLCCPILGAGTAERHIWPNMKDILKFRYTIEYNEIATFM